MYTYPTKPNEIYHYGIKRRSGRYPWGSGDRPYQSESKTGIGSDQKITKYISPLQDRIKTGAKVVAINIPLIVANATIPGFYQASIPVLTALLGRQLLIERFDKTNYQKKEGPPEKISELKRKSKDSTMSDVNAVNPRRHNQKGRINNCLNCTAAMEMRARGYDVIARSSGSGRAATIWKDMFKDAKIENPRVEKNKGESRRSYVNRAFDNFCNQIEKHGNGARGSAMCMFENMRGVGHSIFWEVKNGTVQFYDGQNKKINNNTLFSLSDPNSYMYVRLDNLKFNDDNITSMVMSSNRKRSDWKL